MKLSEKMVGIPRLSLFFALVMAIMVVFFLYWGVHYTHAQFPLMFFLAALFGLFMAFNIGGNDVANSFGTSVGSKTLTLPQALCVAAIFEISGAVIAGGNVTDTIRNGIVNISALHGAMQPIQFVHIMLSALIAAALWLLFASRKGWPVSTTHAIIGGIVGAALIFSSQQPGVSAVNVIHWAEIGRIAISWVASPILGGICSFILYSVIKHFILDESDSAKGYLKQLKREKKAAKKAFEAHFATLTEAEKIDYAKAMAKDARTVQKEHYDPEDLQSDYFRKLYEIDSKKRIYASHDALQTWGPILAAVGALVIGSMLLFKGLQRLHLNLSMLDNLMLLLMVAACAWMGTYSYVRSLRDKKLSKAIFYVFAWMQVFTASGFAFSHGSNDIANAVGPFAAVLDTLKNNAIGTAAPVPSIVMVAFGISLIGGLWFIGKKVIATVGSKLTRMHPASGFSAELSAACVVMGASGLGIPVSSTHILVGAVLGIGVVNRRANWILMKPIALAWVITLPAAAIISIIAFYIMSLL